MSSESTETQIARLDERLQQILREMELSRAGRKEQYEKLEQLNQGLIQLQSRVKGVEDGLTKASPTIDEFVNIKMKVQGAGIFGRWVWAVGGTLLGALAVSREAIFTWFSK